MVESQQPYAGDTTRSPIVALHIGAIVCAYLGIGIMGAYLPREVPLAWPIGFLIASAAFTIAALAFLSQRRLAWKLFFTVVRWVSLVNVVYTGMAVFIFVWNDTPGRTVLVMAGVLLLSAINLPVLVAYSVARHERAGH